MLENISVVIACYNRLEILKDILPSYLNQKGLKEVILVDDSTNDKIKSYINEIKINNKFKYNKLKYIKNLKREGTCETKNIGMKKAIGKYIFIGEDDVELINKNYLSLLLNHLKNKNADIISGKRIWGKAGESKIESILINKRLNSLFVDSNLLLEYCKTNVKKDKESFLLDACMLIKREVINKVLFDSTLFKDPVAWRNETEFQINASKKCLKLIFCPHALCYHYPKPKSKIPHIRKLLKYDYFVIINNYKFAKKHKYFLKEKFGIKNISLYALSFSLDRIKKRYFAPLFKKIVKN